MAILRHKLFNPARASSCGSGAAAPALLLLLHGTGDNEGGLLPLGGLAPEGTVVASLRAPLQAPFGGFRWFEGYSADPEPVALERTIATSTDAVFDFIEAAPSTLGTDPERVYVLGFSRAGRHGHLGDATESVASAELHRRCRRAERQADARAAAARHPAGWEVRARRPAERGAAPRDARQRRRGDARRDWPAERARL
eukprot:scaffold51514_cov64-Phaeocystis_antarctica.AAC.3